MRIQRKAQGKIKMKNNEKKEASLKVKIFALVMAGFMIFGVLAATIMALVSA